MLSKKSQGSQSVVFSMALRPTELHEHDVSGVGGRRPVQHWIPIPRLCFGTQKAAGAVAHYQIRVMWKVLHEGVRYRQPDTEALNHRSLVARVKRALTQLRKLGYDVSITAPQPQASASGG